MNRADSAYPKPPRRFFCLLSQLSLFGSHYKEWVVFCTAWKTVFELLKKGVNPLIKNVPKLLQSLCNTFDIFSYVYIMFYKQRPNIRKNQRTDFKLHGVILIKCLLLKYMQSFLTRNSSKSHYCFLFLNFLSSTSNRFLFFPLFIVGVS